jgi:four helix bundle protein
MDCTPELLRVRTKQFALRIIQLARALPRSSEARVIGMQLLRSGTSVAANYCAACRARSRPDFISKLGVVVEETDESVFWLELLAEAGLVKSERMQDLYREANELLRIFSAARQTSKKPASPEVPKITNRKSQISNVRPRCPPARSPRLLRSASRTPPVFSAPGLCSRSGNT